MLNNSEGKSKDVLKHVNREHSETKLVQGSRVATGLQGFKFQTFCLKSHIFPDFLNKKCQNFPDIIEKYLIFSRHFIH